ncbi:MAG: hypothetical protein Q8O41_02530 [Candidatus Methanoperedens sp.]|nr:hypothetical protein [Candidatus Methanoperedens sp.]
MELTNERIDTGRDCKYMQDSQECPSFVIRESAGLDYACAAILLRNLGERKDTTSLEREALSAAIRLLQRSGSLFVEDKK